MVCLSYRGYWTSRGRPSERGIRLDTRASLEWIAGRQRQHLAHSATEHDEARKQPPATVVLWGQSVGGGFATFLAAQPPDLGDGLRIAGLILETPFLSMRAMLEAFYPQKWLPYRYLWPLLRNQLDNWAYLGHMASRHQTKGTEPPRILILAAGVDEVVPSDHAERLHQRAVAVGLPAEKTVVLGALHTEAAARGPGQAAIARALSRWR